MDINYSSLLQQLARQKENSQKVFEEHDPTQRFKRMMNEHYAALGDKTIRDSRMSQFRPPQDSVEDRVDREMAESRQRTAYTRADAKTPNMLEEEAATAAEEAKREQQEMKYAASQKRNPIANYLSGVTGQDDYRSAMIQYLSAGGKKPDWYTGDYASDKMNIDTAIEASMTPREQLQRREAQQRLDQLQDYRQERLNLQKQAQQDKVREQVAKREAVKPTQIIPTSNERKMANEALEGVLGADMFDQLPREQTNEVARTVAAKAKAKMATPEGKGLDYETLLQDELDELIAKGQLKKGKEGGWFGIGSEKPSFTRAAKSNVPQAPAAGTIYKGYKFKGGDPANPNSWEKQ